MNKNQNLNYIFLLTFIIFSLCWPYQSHSQQNVQENNLTTTDNSPDIILFQADSLFQNMKYTESYILYKKIFDHDKISPGMLLKMAFIQEGLGNYGSALYYLNLYYLQTSNKQVLTKMESLASKYQLVGYEYSDSDYFLSYYNKYQVHITFTVLILVLLFFGLIYYQIRKSNKKPVMAGVFFVILLGGLYFQVNYGNNYSKGIVLYENSYLMNAPSSGADLIEIINQGHRVKILGKEDIWIRIYWNGSPAYIRENNIRTINL